jgi:hypothetical protein
MTLNPFVFGKTVQKENFCNRVKDGGSPGIFKAVMIPIT